MNRLASILAALWLSALSILAATGDVISVTAEGYYAKITLEGMAANTGGGRGHWHSCFPTFRNACSIACMYEKAYSIFQAQGVMVGCAMPTNTAFPSDHKPRNHFRL